MNSAHARKRLRTTIVASTTSSEQLSSSAKNASPSLSPREPQTTSQAPAPVSALAARKAAAAANLLAAHQPHRANGDSLNDSESDSDVQPASDIDSSSASEVEDKSANKILLERSRTKQASSRYYANPEPSSSRPPTRNASIEPDDPSDVEMAIEPENDGDADLNRDLNGAGKGKMGRGKRQRREKSAFLDPGCVSRFKPLLDDNALWIDLSSASENLRPALILGLDAGENVLIHGSCRLSVLAGAVTTLNATLSTNTPTASSPLDLSSLESITHPFFAPSSHPLPPIEAASSFSSSSSPLSVLLPNGTTRTLPRTFAAVLLLRDLSSGIEGIETVLRHAGMGCGNHMWNVPEWLMASVGSGQRERWAGEGWRLVTDATPTLTSLRPLDEWNAGLNGLLSSLAPSAVREDLVDDEEDDNFNGSEPSPTQQRLALLVEGPKRVGKSTFAKMLINGLLEKFGAVAYLDTDLGQPEFSPPGFLSLNVLRRPVLGPSFTHMCVPVASHYLGSTSPASDPSAYSTAVSSLLQMYRDEIEFEGDVVPARSRRRGAREIADHNGSSGRMPLIVNTQGWVKGLGADLLVKLKADVRPTHIYSIGRTEEDHTASVSSHTHVQVVQLPAAPSSPLESKWSTADLRTLALIAYFHSSFPSSTPRSYSNRFPSAWDFSTPLVSRSPYTIDWTASAGQLRAVQLLDGNDVPYEQILHVLNGSLVAISLPSSAPDFEQSLSPTAFPYSSAFSSALSSPATGSLSLTQSFGLGLVRSIDPTAHALHILTPVPLSRIALETHDGLVLLHKSSDGGGVELPLPLMLDHTATEAEAAKGVCGTEWKDVPYLSVGGDGGQGGSGRRRVRRNLMRRAQA